MLHNGGLGGRFAFFCLWVELTFGAVFRFERRCVEIRRRGQNCSTSDNLFFRVCETLAATVRSRMAQASPKAVWTWGSSAAPVQRRRTMLKDGRGGVQTRTAKAERATP